MLGSLRDALDRGLLWKPTDAEMQPSGSSALLDTVGTGTVPPPAEALAAHNNDLGYFRVVADIATQVATGLAYAHSCGVVHCDVKAENVMLQRLSADQRFEGARRPCYAFDKKGLSVYLRCAR